MITTANLYSQDDSTYFNRLFYTSKVWGFVKYFHSEVADCSINWDSVLVAKLPEIKNASSNTEFNTILYDLITNPGETALPTEPLPVVPDSLMFNLNTSWFDDEIFTAEVKDALDTIHSRFRPGPHCLVEQAFYNGNPIFDDDDQYHSPSGNYPEEEVRILGLFRYWNIINYFFPYKNLMDQDWDETLIELIPLFYEAENSLEYSLAAMIMAKRINDSHAFIAGTSENFGSFFPRFAMGYFEDETVIYKVHNSIEELQPGDIVRVLDGYDIDYLRDSLEIYTHGSNDIAIQYYVHDKIIRGDYGSFDITVENDNGISTYTFSRNWGYNLYNDFLSNTGPVWYDTLVDQSCLFGYVDMELLTSDQVGDMMDDLWDTDAIIFDVRGYPQGTLWTLVYYLFTEPLHIANFTVPDIEYPGTLFWNEETIGGYNSALYSGHIIILFDIHTISQAEYTCMGLDQFPESIKIGSTTQAADGNISAIYMPGTIYMWFTGLGTFYPDYTPTQRIGIIPDIEVWPTIEGIRQGKDEVLEVAFDCLLVNQHEMVVRQTGSNIELFPNPSSGSANLRFTIHETQFTICELFDISGVMVKSFINEVKNPGTHEMVVELRDLKPGIYFCVLKTNAGIQTKKLIKL